MDLNSNMNNFRWASRDLFNSYFKVEGGWDNCDAGWIAHERFSNLRDEMFRQMVLVPSELNEDIPLGQVNSQIHVCSTLDKIPAMINRETFSGYWDFPTNFVSNTTELLFIDFFDWDSLFFMENQYIQASIFKCPDNLEIEGKQALIEARHISFQRGDC